MAVEAGSVVAGQQGQVVQFYGRDEELTSAVAGYLARALTAGGSAVLAATPAHCEAILDALTAAGHPAGAAEQDGRLRCLDAEQLLSRFVTGGRVDPAAFEAEVGPPVRPVAVRPPLAVNGEMVAVLWGAGDVHAAEEVEKLWNGLPGQVPFELYCGYPDGSCAGDPQGRARVGWLHSTVIGPPAGLRAEGDQPWRTAVSRTFHCVMGAPREARHFTAHLLRQWQLDGGHREADPARRSRLGTDVALVVSELAANAVLHARTAFTVSAARSKDGVYLSVADHRPLPEAEDSLPVRWDHGLGMMSRVTDRWGVRPVPGGKAVWAHLPLPG